MKGKTGQHKCRNHPQPGGYAFTVKRNLRIAIDILLLLAGAGYLFFVFTSMPVVGEKLPDTWVNDSNYRIRLVTIGFFAGLMLTPWLMRRLERKFTPGSVHALWVCLIPMLWALGVALLLSRLLFQPLQMDATSLQVWLISAAALYGFVLVQQSRQWFWAWMLAIALPAAWLWNDCTQPYGPSGWVLETWRATHRALPYAAGGLLAIALLRAILRARSAAWHWSKHITATAWLFAALIIFLLSPNPATYSLNRLPYISQAALLPDGSLVLEAKKTYLFAGVWEDTVLLIRSPGEKWFRSLRRNRVIGYDPDSVLGSLTSGSNSVISREEPTLLAKMFGLESEINIYHLPDGKKTIVCKKHCNDSKLVFNEDCPIWLGPDRAWATSSNDLDYYGVLANGKPFNFHTGDPCRSESWSGGEYLTLIKFCEGRDDTQPTNAKITRLNWRTGMIELLQKKHVWGTPRDWNFRALGSKMPLVSLPDGTTKYRLFHLDHNLDWVRFDMPTDFDHALLGWKGEKPVWFKLHPIAEALGQDLHSPSERIEQVYDRSELRIYENRSFLALMDRQNAAEALYEVDFIKGSIQRIGSADYHVVELSDSSWRYTSWLSCVQWLNDSIVFVEHGEFGQRVVQYFPKDGRREVLLSVPYRNKSALGPWANGLM